MIHFHDFPVWYEITFFIATSWQKNVYFKLYSECLHVLKCPKWLYFAWNKPKIWYMEREIERGRICTLSRVDKGKGKATGMGDGARLPLGIALLYSHSHSSGSQIVDIHGFSGGTGSAGEPGVDRLELPEGTFPSAGQRRSRRQTSGATA